MSARITRSQSKRKLTDVYYEPLDRRARDIRIVVLHHGQFDDPIECSLELSSLENAGRYEALSYAWGDASKRCSIKVNQIERSITISLKSALRHLRMQSTDRRLWIDALCINQDDDDERQHQVELMCPIYQGSSRVLVWLGPSEDASDSGMDLLSSLASERRQSAETLGLSESQMPSMMAVTTLLQRPYWQRLWIRQEVSVHVEVPLVVCGHRSISWRAFHEGLFRLRQYGNRLTYEWPSQCYVIVRGLRYTRKSFQSSHYSNRLLHWHKIGGPRTNLLDLIFTSRFSLATDPHDHIYALLGLIRTREATQRADIMVPSYAHSVSETFCAATRMFLRLEGTLEFLHLRATQLAPKTLPTWVPDYRDLSTRDRSKTCTRIVEFWANSDGPLRSASGLLRPEDGSQGARVLEDDEKTLIAPGLLLDRVMRTISVDGCDPGKISAIRKAVVQRNAEMQMATGAPANPGPELDEVLWRTLVANGGVGTKTRVVQCPAEWGHLYRELVREGNQEEQASSCSLNIFQHSMQKTCWGTAPQPSVASSRRILLFEDRLVGLGPPQCRKGDLLCLLGGYSMPAILRPQGQYFEFVGDAYVHGIMDGEAACRDGWPQEFAIR